MERRQYESLDELIQNELAELDFDQLTSVDQDYFNGKYPPDIEPYIFCEWSESPVFEDGKRYGIREFDTLMKQADEEQVAGAKAALENTALGRRGTNPMTQKMLGSWGMTR